MNEEGAEVLCEVCEKPLTEEEIDLNSDICFDCLEDESEDDLEEDNDDEI